jgi:phosphoribosylformimino-5-aminoimidazole carboxamide ribotide isomerase
VVGVKVIPVLDLKDGMVVHARCGNRALYQPINTPLCASADVFQVLAAFLDLYPFDTFYFADLNAITGQGDHRELINSVLEKYPDITFWVDCGYQRYQKQLANYLPVLGSECFSNAQLPEMAAFNKQFVLSLDYSSDKRLGATDLFTDSLYWPETVIIMTLARVGSQQGADYEKLATYCQTYPNKNFVAAGGIRNIEDLLALKKLGIKHALLASALHSGAIKSDEITKL